MLVVHVWVWFVGSALVWGANSDTAHRTCCRVSMGDPWVLPHLRLRVPEGYVALVNANHRTHVGGGRMRGAPQAICQPLHAGQHLLHAAGALGCACRSACTCIARAMLGATACGGGAAAGAGSDRKEDCKHAEMFETTTVTMVCNGGMPIGHVLMSAANLIYHGDQFLELVFLPVHVQGCHAEWAGSKVTDPSVLIIVQCIFCRLRVLPVKVITLFAGWPSFINRCHPNCQGAELSRAHPIDTQMLRCRTMHISFVAEEEYAPALAVALRSVLLHSMLRPQEVR